MLQILAAVITTFVAACFLVTPMMADFSQKDWQLKKAILLPTELQTEGFVELIPDQDVYAGSKDGLADLRIVEESSEKEIPYKVLVERGQKQRKNVAVHTRDLGSVPGKETSFVAEIGETGALHNEIEIQTTSKNFQRKVSVEGSQDGTIWTVLQKEQTIFDFTVEDRGFSQRNTRVQYAQNTMRYLKVHIADVGEDPLVVTGALVSLSEEITAQQVDYPAGMASRQEEETKHQTLITFDLGAVGIPTNRLNLSIPQTNFYRKVLLEGSDDQQRWTSLVSSGTLYSYNTPKFVGANLNLSYSERPFRFLRLTINNEDDSPLPLTGAEVSVFLRRIIFQAQPGVSYSLYFGNSGAHAPSYDLEKVFPYLVTDNLPRAELGMQTSNSQDTEKQQPDTGKQQPAKAMAFTDQYPWLLPTVITVASLIIGLFLFRVFRSVQKSLPPPP